MTEETLNRRTVYTGTIVDLEVVDVRCANGVESVREIVRHGGAAALVARRRDGTFVFVRQYRKAVESFLLEVVAGTLEPGEDPEPCARRELLEESGYRADAMQHLGFIHPSPGYVTERIDIFYAETGLDPVPAEPDRDENLEVCLLTESEVEEAIRSGSIVDGKTLAAWQLYRSHRDMPGAAGGAHGGRKE